LKLNFYSNLNKKMKENIILNINDQTSIINDSNNLKKVDLIVSKVNEIYFIQKNQFQNYFKTIFLKFSGENEKEKNENKEEKEEKEEKDKEEVEEEKEVEKEKEESEENELGYIYLSNDDNEKFIKEMENNKIEINTVKIIFFY
jgi:hypothetical protein